MKQVLRSLRACFKISRRPAARDFGRGQGGLGGAQRPAAGCEERANAGHGQKTRRPEGFRAKGHLASPCSRMPSELLRGGRAQRLPRRACHPAFCPKTGPLLILKQALKPLAIPFIRLELPRTQRARPKSRFVRARFAPTACPQAGASAYRSAEAKPALAPASRARTARQGAVSSRDPGTPPSGGSLRRQPMQGAVSSPRRYPTQPLRGSMWHKWLKVAAWTLAFCIPPSGRAQHLTVRNLITPSPSTTLRT